MKMPFLSLKVVAPLCLALASGLLPANAQQKPATVVADARHYDLEVVGPASGRFLVHKGNKLPATVGNAVDILRELQPEVSFALAPGVAEIELINLKLFANSVNDALEGLAVASGNRFVFLPPIVMQTTDPATGLPMVGSASGLYRLQLADSHRNRSVEAFNLSAYLEKYTKEEERHEAVKVLEMTIYDTLEAFRQTSIDSKDKPEFKFHPNANLLIVIGPLDTIEISHKIIGALVSPPGMTFGGGRDNHSSQSNPLLPGARPGQLNSPLSGEKR